MPYTPSEQRSVQIGNAMNVAATLASNAGSPQEAVDTFFAIVDGVVDKVLEVQAVNAVKDEFPATTVATGYAASPVVDPNGAPFPTQDNQYPVPPQVPQPAQPQAPQGFAPHPAGVGSSPAPIPQPAQAGGGQLKDGSEELWRMFFDSPNQFVDNRASKRNPKAADFVHSTLKNAKDYKLGLWINGQYPNADWVQAELRQRGFVA